MYDYFVTVSAELVNFWYGRSDLSHHFPSTPMVRPAPAIVTRCSLMPWHQAVLCTITHHNICTGLAWSRHFELAGHASYTSILLHRPSLESQHIP